jgi:NAD(P)-dependent dehydrogenase (short-subunit alcohol dehydrogenase family)
LSNSEKRLSGKNVFLTGAGSGLGKAMALRFAREGATLIINDINKEAAEKTVKEVEQLGQRSAYYIADVSNDTQVKEMIKKILGDFNQIDILVNNAGVGASFASIIHMKNDIWDRIIKNNLYSVFYVSKYVAQRMIKNDAPPDKLRGKIINMSSMRGKRGRSGFGAYSASKFGIVSLTQTLALELGKHRITVNAICPGLIHTPMYGPISIENLAGSSEPTCLIYKPVGLPEDVAGVAAFLASSDSDFITGQSIPVSGGMHFV